MSRDQLDMRKVRQARGQAMPMEREVFIVRDGAVVWRGLFRGTAKDGDCTTQACFKEAWGRALQEGAVNPADAGQVRFRFSPP